MKKEKSELEKAFEEGYTDTYFFSEGQLYNVEYPHRQYYPKDIHIEPRPCPIENQVVYRLTFPDNTKGNAVCCNNSQNDF